MTNGLKLGTGVANGATKGPDNASHEDVGKNAERPDNPNPLNESAATVKPGAPEGAQDVADRLNRTQPVSGDNDVASQNPDQVRRDPPTPAEERKDTIASTDLRAKLEESIGLEDAKNQGPVPEPSADDGVKRWSSHPILNYKLGRFKFDGGLLALKEDKDIEEFEGILKKLPLSERLRIKDLDLSAAEAQVRAVRDAGPHASKKIGSDSGDRDPGKQVGKGRLEDSGE